MPNKAGRLTEQESSFIEHYVLLQDAVKAATLAGYRAPERQGPLVFARPAIQDAIQDHHRMHVKTVLVPLVDLHLAKTLRDPNVSIKDKNQAASIVLRRDEALSGGPDAAQKEIYEMSADELAAQIQKLEALQAAKAHQAKQIEGQAIEIAPDPFD